MCMCACVLHIHIHIHIHITVFGDDDVTYVYDDATCVRDEDDVTYRHTDTYTSPSTVMMI